MKNPIPQPGLLWCPRTLQQEALVRKALLFMQGELPPVDDEAVLIPLMLSTMDCIALQREGKPCGRSR